MNPIRLRPLLAVLPLLAAVACAPAEESSTSGPQSPSVAESLAADTCSPDRLDTLEAGRLTVGTDKPAFEPWFTDNDPTTGKGFESAVAYAVAGELGYTSDQVDWVRVPFNSSYAPGAKKFDVDINQISITPARAKVVDFSDGYYEASQAVIALKDSPAADATSLADLKPLRLGAQTGTTSLTAIREVIQPDQAPLVFEDTNAAKQALTNDQLDAILADLPTAFFITAVEIPKGTIVGQFQPSLGSTEEFGMLFEKGSSLVPCVNEALDALRQSGTLDRIEKEWLSETVGVPELQ